MALLEKTRRWPRPRWPTRWACRGTKARLAKLKDEKFLLQEGLGLQIKDTFLGLNAAQKSPQATFDAMKAATENRELNTVPVKK
ncbi:MAG: hypothetical protein AAB676_14595 [Verrucomicrobiota bacterium]